MYQLRRKETLSQTSASIEVGDKMVLIATVLPANAVSKELQWSSSNEDIAMVSQKGIVLAMGEGMATISVKATDSSGVKTSCTITCVTSIATITSDNDSFNIYDTNGVVHTNVKRGLNIIKMSDGTSKKILIK